ARDRGVLDAPGGAGDRHQHDLRRRPGAYLAVLHARQDRRLGARAAGHVLLHRRGDLPPRGGTLQPGWGHGPLELTHARIVAKGRARMKCIVAAAALLAAAFQAFAQAPAEPIRIGFLSVRTGALAAGGQQMEDGITPFLKEPNTLLAGRKVELVIADTGGSPPQ